VEDTHADQREYDNLRQGGNFLSGGLDYMRVIPECSSIISSILLREVVRYGCD